MFILRETKIKQLSQVTIVLNKAMKVKCIMRRLDSGYTRPNYMVEVLRGGSSEEVVFKGGIGKH